MRRWMFLLLILITPTAGAEEIKLGLKDALSMVHKRNAQVIMADERVQQALARVGQAASGLLPHLEGTLEGSRQTRDLRNVGITLPNSDPHIGPFNAFDTRVRVTQAIFDAGAIARMNAAAQGRALSVAELNKVEEDVLALVAALYINAKRAEENLEAARVVLGMNARHWKIARARFKQGTASELDVAESKNLYAESYLRWRQAHARATQTRVDLCAALDIPQESKISFAGLDMLDDVKVSPADAAAVHPDIEVAKRALAVNSAQRNAEKADWLPKISALGDYGSSGEDPDNSSATYTIGVRATFPIWEGGNREHRIREADSKVRESEANVGKVERETRARITSALDEIEQSRAMVREARAKIELAQTRWKVARQRLDMGSGTALDLFDAKTDKALAVDAHNEAVATYKLSRINLAHAMGRMKDLAQTP